MNASTLPELREQAARALVQKVRPFSARRAHGPALGVYQDLVQRLGTEREPALESVLALALMAKAATLRELGRRDETIAAYLEVVRRFGGRWPFWKHVVRTFAALAAENQGETAIRFYRCIVRELSSRRELGPRKWAAWALAKEAVGLAETARFDEAFRIADELVSEFQDAEDHTLAERAEWAREFKRTARSTPPASWRRVRAPRGKGV